MRKIVNIPLYLLPDVIEVRVPIDGKFGGEYSEPKTILHVRWEPMTSMSHYAYAIVDGAQGRLYIDAKNSAGFFCVPTGSLVKINGGEELSVLKVNGFFETEGILHHIELDVG